jgi:hypothetical protein
VLFDWHEEEQMTLWGEIATKSKEMPSGSLTNEGMYASLDRAILYGIVRTFKPAKIIEVGSGHSTTIAASAAAKNKAEGNPVHHTCIEPYRSQHIENNEDIHGERPLK